MSQFMMMGGSGQGPPHQQQVPTMPWKDPRAWTVRDYEKLSEVLEEWASRENGKLNLLNNNPNSNNSGGRGGAGGGFPNWPGMQGPQQGGGGGGGGYWDGGGGGGGEYGGRHSGSGSGSSGRRSRRSVHSSPSFIPSVFFSCSFVLTHYISILFDPEFYFI